MARSINDIQQIILDKKNEFSDLDTLTVTTTSEKTNLENLTSTSKVAIWRLFVFIVSFGIWSIEKLFDVFKIDIEALIALNKIHNYDWYLNEVKSFQYGFPVDSNSRNAFDNSNIEIAQVETSKIIKQASIDEVDGILKFKLAKEDSSGNLLKLTDTERVAVTNYMSKRKDAGTRIIIVSKDADSLKLNLNFYYDPNVLEIVGGKLNRIDGAADNVVETKINAFARNLEFNGDLIITKLVDYLQTIQGSKAIDIELTEAKPDAGNYTNFDEIYKTTAGWFLFDDVNSTINYIARNE